MKDKVKEFREKNPELDFAAGFIPGVGEAQDAHDFVHAAKKRDIAGMSWALLGLVIPGLAGGQLRKLAKFGDNATGGAVRKIMNEALPAGWAEKGWTVAKDGAFQFKGQRFIRKNGKLVSEKSISDQKAIKQTAQKIKKASQPVGTEELAKLKKMGLEEFDPKIWFSGRKDVTSEDKAIFMSHMPEFLDIAKKNINKTLVKKSDGWYGQFADGWKKTSLEDYIVSLSDSFKKSGLEWDGVVRYNALRKEAYDDMIKRNGVANWTTTSGQQGSIFARERDNGPLLRNVVAKDSKYQHRKLDKSQAYQEQNSNLPGITTFNGAIEYGTDISTGSKYKAPWKIFGKDVQVKAIRGNNGNFDMSKAHPYLGIIPPAIGLIAYKKYDNSNRKYD